MLGGCDWRLERLVVDSVRVWKNGTVRGGEIRGSCDCGSLLVGPLLA